MLISLCIAFMANAQAEIVTLPPGTVLRGDSIADRMTKQFDTITPTDTVKRGVISFSKDTVHLGTFSENKVQRCEYEFYNDGDAPLEILQVQATCGCTRPIFSKEKVMPGERGVIRVEYDGKGKPEGRFKRSIVVRSTARNRSVRLFLDGIMTKN